MANKLLEIAAVYAPLSFATIGGGQTIVADVQRQVVDSHHWLTNTEFLNAFAIARMAPGPGSLLATLLGWQVAGLAGAIVATLSIFGPTAIMMLGVAHVWSRHRGARWQMALERGLRPVATGMIVATAYVLFISLDGGWPARIIALFSTVVIMFTRINALIVLAACAGAYVGFAMMTGG
ncbi:chromate transporter [Terrarubrum flagellatum]|uniref:chromate transporter n=1 Tax=Terrirubrum flagellatum TaxID=2895980 RepID=UPI0031456E72